MRIFKEQRNDSFSGRKANCFLYAVMYGIACITKHFANFYILAAGRFFAGVATSILFSAFESWLVCEHNKVPSLSLNAIPKFREDLAITCCQPCLHTHL